MRAKIAARGTKSLASVAVPLQPRGFLELRPNYSCVLLFCGAALQLRRAGATGSAMRILEEQAWNGAESTMFQSLGRWDNELGQRAAPHQGLQPSLVLRCNITRRQQEDITSCLGKGVTPVGRRC